MIRARCKNHKRRTKHKNYPYKVFGGIRNPGVRQQVSKDMECKRRMDAWSAALPVHHKCMDNQLAQQDAAATGACAFDETVLVELLHGQARRFIFAKSVRCPCLDLCMLNQHWLLSRVPVVNRDWHVPVTEGAGN